MIYGKPLLAPLALCVMNSSGLVGFQMRFKGIPDTYLLRPSPFLRPHVLLLFLI